MQPEPGRIAKIVNNARGSSTAGIRREVLEGFALSERATVRSAAE
jgi:hypothetical protein